MAWEFGPRSLRAVTTSKGVRKTETCIQSLESITYIILADVHPFGTHRNGDVDAIVDDQRNIVSSSDPVKILGCPYQFGRVGCLIPVLDYCGTWNDSEKHHFWPGRLTGEPPLIACSTASVKRRFPRMAGVESVTR